MVVLPAPRNPTSATLRRSVRSCCAENSSSPADEPKARATSCSRATEMFPCPDSSSARKRSETPLRSASSRRLRPRSSLRRRTAAPTADRRTWCSRVIYVHYIASLYLTTSNIVLASAKGLRYLLAPMDTNETRLAIEDASQNSGIRFLAACNGATAGGGYELALACDEIVLIDDGSSTVALPEVPLLGVLPGTGGLTRVVDKRKVRRDLADAFSTLAEGVKGKRAVEWGLVDAVVPRSKFADTIAQKARELAAKAPNVERGKGIQLDEIGEYKHVSLEIDDKARVAHLTVRAPAGEVPKTAAEALAKGAQGWALRMARELDHALLRLRFEHETVGLVLVRTEGDRAKAHAVGELLAGPEKDSWILRETRLLLARTLRRMDVTARSFFAVVDEKSCFSGPLFELLMACDRQYVLDTDGVAVHPGSLSAGALPGWNGLSRLQTRFLADPAKADKVLAAAKEGPIDAAKANKLGLATVHADDIDFEEELRVAVEERASLSPDALTGMEQNYRFAGPETLATKIFGRLSAWQNWIFIRPNATGERGALSMYGKPERPQFDFRRT